MQKVEKIKIENYMWGQENLGVSSNNYKVNIFAKKERKFYQNVKQ